MRRPTVARGRRWAPSGLVWLALLIGGLAPVGAVAQAGIFRGRVIDAADGAPLRDATVVALDAAGARRAAATSDSLGRFELRLPVRGPYTVVVRHPWHAPRTITGVDASPSGPALEVRLEALAVALAPQVISASLDTESAHEAPAGASIVTSSDIGERIMLTPVDVLRTATGVDLASKGLIQSTYTVRGDRSLNQASLLMLADHRNAAVPSLGFNVPYLLPQTADDIERIEVVRGPAAALYGPDAHRGVLHILSRSPFDSRGASLSLTAGERDLVQGTARLAGLLGSRLAFKVSGEYLRGRDWEHTNPGEAVARDFRVERAGGEARLEWRPDSLTTVTGTAGVVQAMNVIDLTSEAGAVQVRDWRYSFAQATARRGSLFANVTYNLSDAGSTFFLIDGGPVVDDSRQLAAQLRHSVGGRPLTVLYGVDGRWTDPRTGGTIHGRNENDDLVAEVGGYLQGRATPVHGLDLVAAVRVDRNNRLDDLVVSPRIGAVFMPATGHAIRLTYNRAFTTPDASDLFMDLRRGSLTTLPYDVRAVAVPQSGYTFRRDCGGLCMRSPFAPPDTFLSADAAAVWDTLAAAFGVPDVPAPTSADVGTLIASFDPSTEQFVPVSPADVRDLAAPRRTITQALEAGYKGILFAGRLGVEIDAYVDRVADPFGGRVMATPNVFLERQSLEDYLATYRPPAEAATIAAGMSSVPIGTISPREEVDHPTDLLIVRRQGGTYTLWGCDISLTAILTPRVDVTGTYSWVSRNIVPDVVTIGAVVLNVPRDKGSLTVRYRSDSAGLTVALAGRVVGGFPFESGIFTETIAPYAALDVRLSYRLPRAPGVSLSLDGYNVLGHRHREIAGAPEIGRLVAARVAVRF